MLLSYIEYLWNIYKVKVAVIACVKRFKGTGELNDRDGDRLNFSCIQFYIVEYFKIVCVLSNPKKKKIKISTNSSTVQVRNWGSNFIIHYADSICLRR